MQFLDWLANHLTRTMLMDDYWVCTCPNWSVFYIPLKLLLVALFSCASLFAQPFDKLGRSKAIS